MLPYLAMAAGLLCAAAGGEFFVRGAVGIARRAGVPPLIVAATVAAFATSSPELTVAISSALAGEPELSFGNVLGGNVANLLLVLGTALLLGPLAIDRGMALRDYFVALAAQLALGLVLADGTVSRLDSAILLAAFSLWLAVVIRAGRAQRSAPEADETTRMSPLRAGTEILAGLAILIAAGKLIVFGAENIARQFGFSEFMIGATVVAVGTTTPELATAIVSRLRGHHEVGLGALLGSSIFNSLFIVGVTGAIAPIRVEPRDAAPALLFTLAALALSFPKRDGVIARWRGVALLTGYVAYLAISIAWESDGGA